MSGIDFDSGGPAFPLVAQNWNHKGMSLRDYFAAKALQGMLATEQIQMVIGNTITPEKLANACYDWADAMLKAREK